MGFVLLQPVHFRGRYGDDRFLRGEPACALAGGSLPHCSARSCGCGCDMEVRSLPPCCLLRGSRALVFQGRDVLHRFTHRVSLGGKRLERHCGYGRVQFGGLDVAVAVFPRFVGRDARVCRAMREEAPRGCRGCGWCALGLVCRANSAQNVDGAFASVFRCSFRRVPGRVVYLFGKHCGGGAVNARCASLGDAVRLFVCEKGLSDLDVFRVWHSDRCRFMGFELRCGSRCFGCLGRWRLCASARRPRSSRCIRFARLGCRGFRMVADEGEPFRRFHRRGGRIGVSEVACGSIRRTFFKIDGT